jgi:transposase
VSGIKYVGLDVHTATIVCAVVGASGKVLLETILQTSTPAITAFFGGLTGAVHVTFEETTQAAWLYDLLAPRVERVVVCDPRKNTLLQSGSKADKLDARRLAELLRLDALTPVYHGEHGTRALKERVRTYDALVGDCTRTMNRIKAVYRARAIPCSGQSVYHPKNRARYLERLTEPGAHARAQSLYHQLDALLELRRDARTAMIAECRSQPGYRILKQVPALGPVRIAQLIAAVVTPHRFRSKREFWSYCGLAVVTKASAEYVIVDGAVRKSRKGSSPRGLNPECNRQLKYVFKTAATAASGCAEYEAYYARLLKGGLRPEIARVTLARKLAATVLSIWKRGATFDVEKISRVSA